MHCAQIALVLQTIRALPDDCSLEEIAERIEFMAAVQKGLDQLDRGGKYCDGTSDDRYSLADALKHFEVL